MSNWWFEGWNYLNDDTDDDSDDLLESPSIWGKSDTGSSYHGRKKYSSSLGWSRNRLTDTTSYYSSSRWSSNYSSYNYSSGSKKAEKGNLILMSKAYKAVRDMIVILDFPFEVIIKLNNCGGGLIGKTKKTRTVCVPSDVMNYSDYSDDAKINILCVLGNHEASHLKYPEY